MYISLSMLLQSEGVEHTRMLAHQHCKEAVRLAKELTPSPYRDGLITITDRILNRLK
jgi:decaprenyl-diphosphate synthase subunit 1